MPGLPILGADMRRREFLGVVGGAAAAWSPAARAQQSTKLRTIGFLGSSTAAVEGQRSVAFVQRLRELGWIEGRTIAIEARWAEGRRERFAEIGAEFLRMQADIIVTIGGAVPALMQVTSVVPIVFTIDADPVGRGLVTSLARPGGNVTGLSVQSTELAGKRLEVLREIIPGIRRFAVLANVGFPGTVQEMAEVVAAAGKLGLEVVTSEIRRAEDIAPAIDTFKGRADALYVCGDAFAYTNRNRINTLALGARLPAVHGNRDYIDAGGLMSYGPNILDLYRRAADFVDKILRGAKPAEIPVEQPSKFDLVINLTTAKALGLTVPPTMLARADEVIE